MRRTLRQVAILGGCAFAFLISGCGGADSTADTETAGAGDASILLLESSSTLLAQAIADELLRTSDSTSAALAIACPTGLPVSAHCEEGSIALEFQTCSLNPIGDADFFFSKLTGQFLSCRNDGLELSGNLSADAEIKLSDGCILGSKFSPCRSVFARLNRLGGSLKFKDASGNSWEMNVLSGFFNAEWSTDGTDAPHANLTDGELDLLNGDGSRYRCVIHEETARCLPDNDGDGVTDPVDNCPDKANANQQDVDGDVIGDACDDANIPCSVAPTCSNNGVCLAFRNACPEIDARLTDRGEDLFCPTDLEGATCKVFVADIAGSTCSLEDAPAVGHRTCYVPCGAGDACSSNEVCLEGCCRSEDSLSYYLGDDDHDGVLTLHDNCPGDPDLDFFDPYRQFNPTQGDWDCDGRGDACDNCPTDYNPDQLDTEFPEWIGDGLGDACDPDIDDDGLLNEEDPCLYIPSLSTTDSDADGTPDVCDVCLELSNPDQTDTDGDFLGDPCDNCPNQVNISQEDFDEDGIGDICDTDWDNDGLLNEDDNCPYNSNPDQADSDQNGIGDACEFGPPDPIGCSAPPDECDSNDDCAFDEVCGEGCLCVGAPPPPPPPPQK